MDLLSIDEIIEASGADLLSGNLNDKISDIVIDSRIADSDKAFVAIVGEKLNGHDFIEAAINSGCKTIIKNKKHKIKLQKNDLNILDVDDTTLALGSISKHYRKKFNIDFVGITGSVGKTTTRDMVHAALSAKYNVLKNDKNFNNQFGVPLTLLKLNDSHQKAVIELGMSNFGEIEYLTDIVEPKIGVITNIGYSHIENLESKDGIMKAKMEMTLNFGENNILVINGDDDYLSKLKNQKLPYTLKTFGFKKDNDIYCESYKLEEKNTYFICVINGKKHEIFIPIMGEHNIYNAMAAITVGLCLGLTIKEIQIGFNTFTVTGMRLDIKQNQNFTIIDDSYNSSPDSTEAALKILSRYKDRKVAILGDIHELGKYAQKAHRLVGKSIVNNCDLLVTIGYYSKYIGAEAIECGFDKNNVYHFENKDDAIKVLDEIIEVKDVILVKASRAMKLETLIKYIEEKNINL